MIWFGTTEKWFEAFIRRIGDRRLVITRGGEAWLGRRGQLPFQSYCNGLTGRRQATRLSLTPNPSTAVPKAVSIIHGANLMHVPRTHPSSQGGLVFPQHSECRQRVIEVVQESRFPNRRHLFGRSARAEVSGHTRTQVGRMRCTDLVSL